MYIKVSKQSKDKIVELREEFDKNHIRQNFIKYLYEKGLLNQFANIIALDKAANGKINNRFVVHHIVPLSYGGSNDFSNLVLMERKLHGKLHKFVYDKFLLDELGNQEFFLLIPEIASVALYDMDKIIFNKYKGIAMEKITSFTIDHIKLKPGIYVSRKDKFNDAIITTFDIRMTSPNDEPVMNTAEMHAIEHLAATFLRNHKEYGNKIAYFGPMGCRTGFYLLLAGDYSSEDVLPLMNEMFSFIRDFKDVVPGACAMDCGNYLDMNLPMANYLANKFINEVLKDISKDRLIYPN